MWYFVTIMKFSIQFILTTFLLSAVISQLSAQPTNLIVSEHTGNHVYLLQNVRSLTLSTGKIHVNRSTGEFDNYDLSSFEWIHFSTSVITLTPNVNSLSELSLFPNPIINDDLNISVISSVTETINFTIINLVGKTLIEKNIRVSQGSNFSVINTAELPSGSYLVRIQNGKSIKVKKILKK